MGGDAGAGAAGAWRDKRGLRNRGRGWLRVKYVFHAGDSLHLTGAELFQIGGQIAYGFVLAVLQGLETLGIRRVSVVNLPEDQVVIVMELVPQEGVGGQCQQADIDNEGREIVYALVVVPGGFQRMLEVLMPVFGAGLPCVLG